MNNAKFRDWVKKEILSSGPISLSDAMRVALTHKDFGYYHSKKIIGTKGDFITGPEISQIYGELIGAFLGYIWEHSGKPSNSLLCEFGPGLGTLSADINRALGQIYPNFSCSPLHLIETSKSFRKIQKTKLRKQSVYWHEDFKKIPKNPVFAVANEFFDALGVDQAFFDGINWRQRLLNFSAKFEYVAGPILNETQLKLFDANHIKNPDKGTIIEYCPKSEQIITEVALHIKKFGGVLLIIDYGKTNQIGDTIQAVLNHKPVEPWSSAGDADISHWVDFQSIKKTAEKAGARFIGPVSQSHFFTQIGIKQRAQNLSQIDNPRHNRAIFAAVDRLISPAHMGNIFQVGLITPTGKGFPPGFEV